MKIIQLGNGGGLADPTLGHFNSSFLIDLYGDDSSYLLFDCGYNIMERLVLLEKEDKSFKIKNIDYIFLSHTHDDHVGNYETLCFWNYFKNNKVMTTYCGSQVVKDYIEAKSNMILEANRLIPTRLFKADLIKSSRQINSKNNTTLYTIEGNHGGNTSHGIVLTIKDAITSHKQFIFISGDTKAMPEIENDVMKTMFNHKPDSTLMFHDFSNWNAPTRNVHACEGDFTIEYSKEFQEQCIKYHTGELEFNKNWREL